jgi:DNA-binding transcriptional LysR family regulator
MDRLSSMAAFVKAAGVGSFATAASALGMSPQMIGKHVTWLESRLGARLLNRRHAGRV